MKLCITGANSSVGRTLLGHITSQQEISALALARSPATLPTAANINTAACDYEDVAALTAALRGADSVIHLAGILFESKHSTYQRANVDSTAAVVKAAQQAGVTHLLFVSVLGAHPESGNPYYRSKGQAEALVLGSGLGATVLRTPLLLGAHSAGGQALCREAGGQGAKLLGGGRHPVQPLDVDDLCAALLAACARPPAGQRVLELCGPQQLPYHELVRRMAAGLGKAAPAIGTVPVWLARTAARISYALKGSGLSPAIIDVITSTESVRENADTALGIHLTPLARTLEKLAGKESP